MDKCPFCGAETRPGDNFCLQCGNRLTPAPSSPQQVQTVYNEATLPEQPWSAPDQGTIPASPAPWANAGESTLATVSDYEQTQRSEGAPAATIDRIENPGRLILRSEDGEVVKEYILEKPEMTVGRLAGSDILLPKDKLASRRHATIHYEDGNYVVHDEGSSNGTFVNGQQLEGMGSRVLHDGDRLGIGEHELIYRAYGSTAPTVEDLPTIAVPYDAGELTYQTRVDEQATSSTFEDYGTNLMNGDQMASLAAEAERAAEDATAAAPPVEATSQPPAPAPVSAAQPVHAPAPSSTPMASSAPMPPLQLPDDGVVTFGSITAVPLPDLPDIAPLTAALSALDGQVMSLQEQLNSTQEALRNHESELTQITAQLRSGVRRVSDRMDSTIADVARKREELSWAELLQLMEDVENNPRDIEYVTKLARKARELRKVFQMHQNVLSTMAECNSLLRSLIGEDR
ncbi:MAG TPA: FHA domain-containing protein [Ktedonobacteraceae bacterium]|nr:FHA domain-containing protein [Ktedonobacteraceae bacterium]